MITVGYGDFQYKLDESWPTLPEGWSLGKPAGVAVDSRDRVYIYNRHVHSVAVFEADSGAFVTSWGECQIKDAHGIYIDDDDFVWLTDKQEHVVTKHTRYGEKLIELGRRGWASVTVTPHGTWGGPFNLPSGVCVDNRDGSVFVADGYGNRQVHRFSAEGELELSWGVSGTGPGEFALVHNLDIDSQGRILICDRENSRIQLFDRDGGYIETWDDVRDPGDAYVSPDGLVYVAEQGGPLGQQPVGVSIFTEAGELICRFRGEESGLAQPHGIWCDSKGNIFVAELRSPDGQGDRMRKYVRL